MTQTQTRGAILHNRLDLLNKYLVTEEGTGKTFEHFLRERKVTKAQFINGLPDKLKRPPVNYDEVFSYAETMNDVYFDQYLKHEKEKEMASVMSDARHADGVESGVVDGDNLPAYAQAETGLVHSSYYNMSARRRERKEEREKRREERKERPDGGKKGLHTIARLSPAFVIARSAFITICDLNVFQMAYNLNRIKEKDAGIWKKVMVKWYNIGGADSDLERAIRVGKNKRGVFGKKMSADGDFHYDGSYSVAGIDDAAIAAYITSATAIIGAMKPLITEFKQKNGEPTDTPDITSLPNDPGTGAISDALKSETRDNGGGKDEPDQNEGLWQKHKIGIIVVSVLALAGIVTAVVVVRRG